jgi:hypothetical protein
MPGKSEMVTSPPPAAVKMSAIDLIIRPHVNLVTLFGAASLDQIGWTGSQVPTSSASRSQRR